MATKQNKDSFKDQFIDIFIGARSIFSVMVSVIGAMLVGNTLYTFLDSFMGAYYTFILGTLLLMIGGFYIGFFKD